MNKYNINLVKEAFKDPRISYLLPINPKKLDIIQLKLEDMSYLELCGLYYIIGDMLFYIADIRFKNIEYGIEYNNIDELYIYMNNKPILARQPIPQYMRMRVWYNAFVDAYGYCFCCNKDIQIYNFECGHIVSVYDNGESTIKNLLPICKHCNLDMGKTNMNVYMANKIPNIKNDMHLLSNVKIQNIQR